MSNMLVGVNLREVLLLLSFFPFRIEFRRRSPFDGWIVPGFHAGYRGASVENTRNAMRKSIHHALMIAVAVTPFLLSGCGVTKPTPVAAPALAPEPAPVRVEPPAKSEWVATASALQEEIYPAAYACDGKSLQVA